MNNMPSPPQEYITPSRTTAINSVTGALIKTRAGSQEERTRYEAGWERIFGNKNKQEKEQE
jgi:hypothetical protein